ncbi:tetratricopeptide repeat protein,FHA domain protein [Leptolyngbyaceae cyanobacterium JSC-12]|nr:tetratricopeptide repeat protein,FHA domain protein [Leptolyngbyaceae cyanobacterium JSC-12]
MLDTGQLKLSREALALFRQGLAAAAVNGYEQAVWFFNQVLELQANCHEVWYERGLALERLGDYIEAIASYDRALSLHPTEDAACEIWHDRGNAFQYGLGDYSQAITCYERALKYCPNHGAIWQNRGNALLYGLSLPEEALLCYDRAIAINPQNNLAWRNRGNSLAELRRYDEAIASYDQALVICPDDQVSWHARSLAAEKIGISDRQPTTNPAWYGSGFGSDQTFVEGDTDSEVIFASKFTAAAEVFSLPVGQPLLIIEDDWGRREIILERDSYVVGRDPSTDICLHSQFVSRQHAVLTQKTMPEGYLFYEIVDGSPDGKASTNGLLINGQRCQGAELQPEDTIVFGPGVRVTYRLLPTSA